MQQRQRTLHRCILRRWKEEIKTKMSTLWPSLDVYSRRSSVNCVVSIVGQLREQNKLLLTVQKPCMYVSPYGWSVSYVQWYRYRCPLFFSYVGLVSAVKTVAHRDQGWYSFRVIALLINSNGKVNKRDHRVQNNSPLDGLLWRVSSRNDRFFSFSPRRLTCGRIISPEPCFFLFN